MIRAFRNATLVVALLLIGGSCAMAQPGPPVIGPVVGGHLVCGQGPTGSNVNAIQDCANVPGGIPPIPGSLVVYNPTDPAYGAKCNGNGSGSGTDDSAAINAMLAIAESHEVPFVVQGPQTGRCVIRHPINLSGLRGWSHSQITNIWINNLRIDCEATGVACIDGMDSRWLNFQGLDILGLGNVIASTSSLTLGVGVQSLTVSAGLSWLGVGTSVAIISRGHSGGIYMLGAVASYDAGTGALVVNVASYQVNGTLVTTTAASISGTTLTIPAGATSTGNSLLPGTYSVTGSGVAPGTTATIPSAAWTGTFTVNNSQSVSGVALTLTPQTLSSWSVTTAPAIGLQVGRCAQSGSADLNYLDRPVIYGLFSFAAYYNTSSETVTIHDPFFSNGFAYGTIYGEVDDGYYHFGVQSSFETCTQPIDSPTSFNENTHIGGWYGGGSADGGAGIWIGDTARHRWIGTYSPTGSPQCIELFQEGGQSNTYLDMDHHCEPSPTVQQEILLTGPEGFQTLNGFRYREHNSQAASYVFKEDAALAGVTGIGMDVRIGYFQVAECTAQLFANPSLWAVDGHFELPCLGDWTHPATWRGGDVVINGVDYVASPQARNSNPDFYVDQQNEGANNTINIVNHRVADRWLSASAVAGWSSCTNNISSQRVTSNVAPENFAALKLTVTSACAPNSTTGFLGIQQAIEGPSLADLQWGTANAQPAVLEVGLRANNTGEYDLSLSDVTACCGTGGNSYVVAANVTQANALQRFSFVIPGPTSGQFNDTPGNDTIIVYLKLAMFCGTNYQTTAGSWQAAPQYGFDCQPTYFNFAGANGATLQIEYVRLRPGVVGGVVTYAHRPQDQELNLSKRFFAKTFAHTVAVGQNKGAAGALTIQAPYASSTNNTLTMNWRFPGPGMYMNNNNIASVPTMTGYSTGVASANCYDVTAGADIGAASFSNISEQGATVTCAVGGGWSLGDIIAVQATADAGF